MTTLAIIGESDDGEPINLTFDVQDGPIPEWKSIILRAAKAALWDERWTPGSVTFKVFTIHGVDLRLGENYK